MKSEFEGFTVYDETPVGWDEHVLPNETVDEEGNFLSENERIDFASADPSSPSRRVYGDPEVEALRERLRQHNGIRGP